MPYKDEDRRRTYNRAYGKEHHKQWYQRNQNRLGERRKQREAEIRAWLRAYKRELFCVECGENHPGCLQFHHKNPQEKNFTISDVVVRSSIERIKLEISKCEVLCANCHAKRHWRENNDLDAWYKKYGEE